MTKSLMLAGVGIADCTGPAGGVNFMGYAMPQQITQGVHTRLRSRAFIFINRSSGKRVIFCSADLPMISQNVKRRVISRLKEIYGSGVYTDQNVLLTATHTHAGPGGFHDYLLYSITSLGYVEETARAMVDGIVQSIINAHQSIEPVRLSLAVGKLHNASINRSPTSYLANPAEERALYDATDGDTDKNMTVLRISSADDSSADANGKLKGMISWFSVHCTSMNNTNRLVSGDNKGYASYLLEKEMNGGENEYLPFSSAQWTGMVTNGSLFVAAFAQSNEVFTAGKYF